MLSNIKSRITELAYSAVNMAEETLKTANGQEKKTAAIEYIVSMLHIIPPLQSITLFLFSKFIDEAVEHAVEYMNKVKTSEA